jgi:hypothetical protein
VPPSTVLQRREAVTIEYSRKISKPFLECKPRHVWTRGTPFIERSIDYSGGQVGRSSISDLDSYGGQEGCFSSDTVNYSRVQVECSLGAIPGGLFLRAPSNILEDRYAVS